MKRLIQYPIAAKYIAALALMLVISVLSMSSAFAEHDRGHGGGERRGGDQGYEGWRGGHDRPHRGYGHGNGYGSGYSYAQPVYVPPPVYVVPPQSPGINLIVPLNLRF